MAGIASIIQSLFTSVWDGLLSFVSAGEVAANDTIGRTDNSAYLSMVSGTMKAIDDFRTREHDILCSYHGGAFFPDSRGNCSTCGAPK